MEYNTVSDSRIQGEGTQIPNLKVSRGHYISLPRIFLDTIGVRFEKILERPDFFFRGEHQAAADMSFACI